MSRALLLAIPLLVVASCAAGLSCDLHSIPSLTSCVTALLKSSKPKLKKLFDPLSLNDINGTGVIDWSVTNVKIHGLSSFEIKVLEIHRQPMAFTVQLAVSWPKLSGTGAGWFKVCPKVLKQEQCISFTAKPHLRITGMIASTQTHLHVSLQGERIRVTPKGAEIGIIMGKLDVVEVNLSSFLGFLDRALNYPSRRYVRNLIEVWWKKNNEKLQRKAEVYLDRLIKKYLSTDLEALLKGIGPRR